jgi:HlyD family secretion protein
MASFLRGRRVLFILMISIPLAIGGAWYYYDRYLPARAAPPTDSVKTAQVTQGDIVISVSGSGEVVPAAEVSLGFQASGVLKEALVDVGDQVVAGDVLARLDDTDAQSQVAEAQISLRQAELQLAQLTADPDASDLASAQAALASAQADLADLTAPASEEDLDAARNDLVSAQAALAELLAGPSEQEVTIAKADMEKAQVELQQAQAEYDKFAWREGFGASSQAATLQQATIDYATAKANYELTMADPTEEELAAARAQVAQARAALEELEQGPSAEELAAAESKVAEAQAALEELQAGSSAEDLESAQLDVEQARNTLTSAQRELAQTELRAPFAGVITAFDASPGETVGTEAFITLADMGTPQVCFWMDETDLTNVAVGHRVNIVFDALPDDTFTGEVIRVEPALVTVDNTPAIQGLASIDLSGTSATLLAGMTADEVEVIAAEARDVLLVPVQALQTLSPGQYAVRVVTGDGSLELRPVGVGLKDLVYAEVVSGLELGEEIATDTATTASSQSSAQPPTAGGPPAGGLGMPFGPGG